MVFTVREALRLPALEQAVLLAGEAGLERIITSVNMMEVPEIKRWVKPNEFLVTTTYPIKDDPAAQARLIEDLAGRGLAALAIKPVWYRNEVPAIMVEQAQRLAFPLIRLPEDASFNEIINPILAEILNQQAAILQRNEEVHRRLTGIVLSGGGLEEIAAMLAEWVHGPVSIHNAGLRLLACAGESIREAAVETSRLRRLIAGRRGTAALPAESGGGRVLIHPVTVAGEEYAYILVWEPEGTTVWAEPTTIEQAGLVVALEITKQRAVAEVERRYQAHLVEELVQGRIESQAVALARGESFGWNLSGSFIPILIQIADLHSRVPAAQAHRELARIGRWLQSVAGAVVSAQSTGSIVVDMGSWTLVLVRWNRSPERKQAREYAVDLAERILREVGAATGVAVSAGVGRPVPDIMQLGTGYRQAARALALGKTVKGPGEAVHFDDLGVYRILAEYSDRRELEHFCQDILAGLREDPESLRTLEAVLAANGNLKQAARCLFIHYNTLRYRVDRLEQTTGLDLSSAEDRLSLQIAAKILRMGTPT